MARNAPRRTRPPARPAGRRPAPQPEPDPYEDDGLDALDALELPSDEPVILTRKERAQKRDLFVVGVLTPAMLVGTLAGVLVLSQIFYPDPDAEFERSRPAPQATTSGVRPTPTAPIVIEPIDPVRLSAGIVEKPPPFEWPEVDDVKVVPNPGRPDEQADYTPLISATELRRLIAVSSVNVVLHGSAPFAQGAAAELAKSYPLQRTQAKVVDLPATLGYIPDDSGLGVVVVVGTYRVQVETIAASPPVKSAQRPEIEYHALHLADHVARRIQEVSSGGRRTGPEAAAVHWRDHIARGLPFGR